MRFVYPARLKHYSGEEVVVSFRDLPECLTSGRDEAEALHEAQDALEEAIAGRMNRVDCIPVPSPRKNGEHMVAVPIDTSILLRMSGYCPTPRGSHFSRNYDLAGHWYGI